MSETLKKHQSLLICLTLIAATIIAYEPVRHNEFISYDDTLYITENPRVQRELSPDSIIWAFTKSHAANWHPITWLSHMLDYQLFGLNPFGHHLVSTTVHIINVLLLFWILSSITEATWASAFVAAVFALHPLQVESVAWASERKTVLSGLFWFMTIAVYIWYTKKPGIWRYISVFAIYGLCIMTKPVVVTLPFVLILLDYWPLGRIGGQKTEDRGQQKRTWVRLVIEKIPLFALSAILSVITVIAQQKDNTILSLKTRPLDLRIANMFASYMKYIYKMIWPSKLTVYYPYFTSDFRWDTAAVCILLFTLITIFLIYMAQRRRYLLFGWLWFAVTLVPVIGLVQAGRQAMANRYMYIPMLGLLIIIGWAAKDFINDNRRRKLIAAALVTVVLCCLVILTRGQVKHWQNSLALFEYAQKCTQMNTITEIHYGAALLEADRIKEAETHLQNAVNISPNYPVARFNLGKVFLKEGRFNEAIECFNTYEGLPEHMVEAYIYLGVAYTQLGRYKPAIQNFTKALDLQPNNCEALNHLAWLMATAPQITAEDANKAIELAERACELTGYRNAMILDTLAAAYATADRFEEAVTMANKAIEAARAAGQKDIIGAIQDHLELFQKGQPYRQK
jgi:protein O-mannosyl-transferase